MVVATPPSPARGPAPKRRRRSGRQRVLLGLGIVVVMAVLAGAAVIGYGWYRWNQVDQQDLQLAEAGLDGPQNFLIVGSDSRDVIDENDADADAFLNEPGASGSGQRSDTIMIARVDASTKAIDLLSFPRDLWVPIEPSGEEQRINTAYSNGGAQNLIDTINADFGIEIHHYVEINFDSFKGVIDAVDGVPMYFDRPMRDEHTGLYQYELGCVTLDGDQGLAFARARHLETKNDRGNWYTDPSGDLGRVNRQQVFMQAVLDRAQQRFGDLDVRAINDIVSSTADNLSIDSGLALGDLVELGRAFRGFSGDQIVTHTLPVTPFMTNGGASVLRLDEVLAEEVLNVFRGLPPGTVSPTSVTLAVSNGSGAENEATRVSGELAALGYKSSIAADQTKVAARTVVRYAPGLERHADQVARQLGNGAELQADRSLSGAKAPIVLVTGTDFGGVLSEARPPADSPATTAPPTSGGSSSSGGSGGSRGPTTTVDPDLVTEPVGVVPNDPPAGTAC
jgi:LCP family protein required for cell wall assembly